MKLIEMNWNPTDRQLRQFGGIGLVALPVLGWMFTSETRIGRWAVGRLLGSGEPFVWDWGNPAIVGVLAAIGIAMAAAACFKPQSLKPVFIGACLIGLPIGMVMSQLILIVIYFGVFTPVALLFRLIGRDALERRFAPARVSYWQPKRQSARARDYFRQF